MEREELYWRLSHPSMRGRRPIEATPIGSYPLADVALLEVTLDEDLPVLTFGDTHGVNTGDRVVAIGNTRGRGLVAVEGRVKSLRDGTDEYPFPLLRVEIGITGGNSGGPLFNELGQVVGIVDREDPNAKGIITFSIPAMLVQSAIEKIKKNVSGDPNQGVTIGYWGLKFWHLKPEERAIVAPGHAEGVWIVNVDYDSPARKAGIKPGDVLLAVDGDREVTRIDRETDTHILWSTIYTSDPGKTLKLEVIRDGKVRCFNMVVGKTRSSRLDVWHTDHPFAVQDMSEEDRQMLGNKTPGVVAVLDDPGDVLFGRLWKNAVITAVAGKTTPSVREFKKIWEKVVLEAKERGDKSIRIDIWFPKKYFIEEKWGFVIVPVN